MFVLKTLIALVVVHELSALVPGVYVAKGMKEEEEREKDQMKELLQKQHIARLKEEEREEEQQRKLAILQKEQLEARQKLLITTKEIDKLLAAGKITKQGATDLRLGLKSASDEELAKYRTWLSEIEEAETKAIAEEESKDKRMDEEDDEEEEEELVEKTNRGVEKDVDKEIAKIIKDLNSDRKQDNLKIMSETKNSEMSKQIQNPVKAQELGVNSDKVRINPPKNTQAKAPNNVPGRAPSIRAPPNIQAAAITDKAKASQPYAARTNKPPAPKANNKQAVQANPGSATIPGKAKANQPYAARTSQPPAPKANNKQAVQANPGSATLRATFKPSQQKMKPRTPADIGAAAVQPAAPPAAQVPIKLAKAPVNRPTNAPVNRPAKAPVNHPAKAPVNRPTKAPVQLIVQPGNIPVVIAVDAPRNPSAVKKLNDAPVEKIELKAPGVVGANAPYIFQPNIPANPPVFVSLPVVGPVVATESQVAKAVVPANVVPKNNDNKNPQGCDPNPCKNSGTCEIQPFGEKAIFCRCLLGFYGDFCEYDAPECLTDPCENSGQCLKDTRQPRGYTCICLKGFTGKSCESVVRTDPLPAMDLVVQAAGLGAPGSPALPFYVRTSFLVMAAVIILVLFIALVVCVEADRKVLMERYKLLTSLGYRMEFPKTDFMRLAVRRLRYMVCLGCIICPCCDCFSCVDDLKDEDRIPLLAPKSVGGQSTRQSLRTTQPAQSSLASSRPRPSLTTVRIGP